MDPGAPDKAVQDVVLQYVRDFFLASRDFNGVLVSRIPEELPCALSDVLDALATLIADGKVSLMSVRSAGNPHIKRLPDLPVAQQLEQLRTEQPDSICAYPSAQVVREATDLAQYAGRPFTCRLALCEAQITPVFFDLDVLDRYYRDPRYSFEFHDFSGSISVQSGHDESGDVAERDKIFLQTFGIGYNDRRERVVVVYLRYLSHLTPEHQQVWNAHAVVTPCTLNADYARATIQGEWPLHYSVYAAFVAEQAEINKLTALIGKPPLFKRTFEEERPDGFTPMLRPTKRNFDDFIHLLDKVLSENISREFFEDDIPLERDVQRLDGKVERERPGTIQLLEDWLRKHYRTSDGEDVAREVLAPLRDIRKLRQKPAHALGSDKYDRSLPAQQDDFLGKACRALTQLRLIFMTHPRAAGYAPPDWLDGDMIVFY